MDEKKINQSVISPLRFAVSSHLIRDHCVALKEKYKRIQSNEPERSVVIISQS